METVVKQVRTTRRPWLIACVVSRRFQEEPLVQSRHMFIKAPREGVATWRSKSPCGEFIERTYEHVTASHSLQGKIQKTQGGHFLGRWRQGVRGVA